MPCIVHIYVFNIHICHFFYILHRDGKKFDPELICALITTNQPKGKVIYPTEYINKSRGFKKKCEVQAAALMREWVSSGSVPLSAIQCMQTHFPNIVQSIPFFKEHASKIQPPSESVHVHSTSSSGSLNEGPSSLNSGHIASESFIPQHNLENPTDLFDLDSDMWEDLPNGEQTKSLEDLLGPEVVRFLIATNRKKARVISFPRLLQHWFVTCKIAQEHITLLLKLLKTFRPTLDEQTIDKLPNSARTLLKVTADELRKVQVTRVQTESGEDLGTYMHYGVEAGVLGTSPGMFARLCSLFQYFLCTILQAVPIHRSYSTNKITIKITALNSITYITLARMSADEWCVSIMVCE